MMENKYRVYRNDELIASYMDLDVAVLLVKAYLETYYNEHDIRMSIMEEPRCMIDD